MNKEDIPLWTNQIYAIEAHWWENSGKYRFAIIHPDGFVNNLIWTEDGWLYDKPAPEYVLKICAEMLQARILKTLEEVMCI